MSISLADARHGAQASRRLLVRTIRALEPFADSLTVVGAHAVHVWVQQQWGPIDMEATRDGDLVLNPVFIASTPKVVDLLAGIGLEAARPERPGIYGLRDEHDRAFGERVTVDLIVPEAFAGPGRRAARVDGQRNSLTRAHGLELAVYDRRLMRVSTLDDGRPDEVSVHVAGPAALIVAKTIKVSERFAQAVERPDRLRPKDSGDIALLMMTCDGATAAQVMRREAHAHREIHEVVDEAARAVVELYGERNSLVRDHMAESLSARFAAVDVVDAVDEWLASFESAYRG
ncbi:hypothetical protein [Agromyces archimandritae]|uniref:Uncharacterized protein n=1 Tax=Agromyces archimandritae TaxID=2781962 RepID=A0A975FKE1_9MICO|nr:hypothetical protein [Agromyces archimandritae]QTX03476.1 hypothetical protein G127AT_08890 [Agromyces archimandritae]